MVEEEATDEAARASVGRGAKGYCPGPAPAVPSDPGARLFSPRASPSSSSSSSFSYSSCTFAMLCPPPAAAASPTFGFFPFPLVLSFSSAIPHHAQSVSSPLRMVVMERVHEGKGRTELVGREEVARLLLEALDAGLAALGTSQAGAHV